MSSNKKDVKPSNPLQDAVNSSLFFRMNLRMLRFTFVAGIACAVILGGLLRLFSVG